LQALLGFREQFIAQTTAAQVIGSTGSEQSRGVYIDKGGNDGIKTDMAVITSDGIVGKVLHVYRSTSFVLLINDQSSGVGAILEKSRLQGILRGSGSGEVVLEKVMSDETVPAGERVLTSGGDRIFPKGLPIGTVTRVSPGAELFLNIRVKPLANLGRLEEVLVVTKIDEKQVEPGEAGPARAVDILAERLPGVPQKPPETPVATGQVPGQGQAAQAQGTATGNSGTPAAPKTSVAPGNTPAHTAADALPKATPAKVSPPKATPAKVTPKPAKPVSEPKPNTESEDSPQ
jgi:rod shape-determining protein MreC